MPDERVVSGTRNPARRGCRHLEGLIGVLEGGPEPSGLCALVGIAEERPHGCGAKVERIHVRVGSGNRRIVKRRPLKLSGRGRQLEPTSLNSCACQLQVPFGRRFARDLADQTSASREPSADPVADRSVVLRKGYVL